MLNQVTQHSVWLACLDAAAELDKVSPHPEVKNREASHFISVSQPTSSGVLNIAPDGDFSTKVVNRTFAGYLQRRTSLNLSTAKKAFDEAEAKGEGVTVGKATTTDRLGDALANNADHHRRHNGVLNATYNMVVCPSRLARSPRATRKIRTSCRTSTRAPSPTSSKPRATRRRAPTATGRSRCPPQ